MLKIGVLGAGHLGKIHLRLLNESDRYELVGFYEPNQEHAAKIEAEFGYKYFQDLSELIENSDVIDIVTPTTSHYESAVKVIQAGKQVFIEKPISATVEE